MEKKDYGKLGFNIHHDGVVADVEPNSLAHYRGLKAGTRIVRIGDDYVINLDHEQMIHILTSSSCLKVTLLMPNEDGSARLGQDGSGSVYQLYSYLSTCSSSSSSNERVIDSIQQQQQRTTTTATSTYNFPLSLNQKGGESNGSHYLPFLSNYSPPKPRRLTITSNFKKKLNRFSASMNPDDAMTATTTTTTTTTNQNENNTTTNGTNAFSNNIYQDRMSATNQHYQQHEQPSITITNTNRSLITGYVSNVIKNQYAKNEKNKENSANTFKNNSMLNGIYLSPIEKSDNLPK